MSHCVPNEEAREFITLSNLRANRLAKVFQKSDHTVPERAARSGVLFVREESRDE